MCGCTVVEPSGSGNAHKPGEIFISLPFYAALDCAGTWSTITEFT